MCTLTLYKSKQQLLLTVNRDEQRERSEAGVHHHTQSNGLEAIYPVDAKAQGTWVAVNNYSLVMCILNNYQSEYNKGLLSRGSIIANAIYNKTLAEAKYWLEEDMQHTLFNPFVLILSDRRDTFRFGWDGKHFSSEKLQFDDWWMESSSSVDYESTINYRKEKFASWQQSSDKETILDFHTQQEQDDLSRSVCMSRSISHTKSITQIDLCNHAIQLKYLSQNKLSYLLNSDTQKKPEWDIHTVNHSSEILV